MVSKAQEQTRTKAAKATQRKKTPELDEEEEQILKKAQIYLLFEAKRPMLWTVAGIREEKGEDGSRRWTIAVHLRYPTGFEGYLGDLLYDGERITELTDLEQMRERARQIAADPEGRRQWDELCAAAIQTARVPSAGHDARHDPAPAVVEAGDPRPGLRVERLRDAARERGEIERGEVRRLVPHSTHLEGQRGADREEPRERARKAIEVGLHQGALLVLEQLDVAVPDELLGRPELPSGR